MFMFVWICVCAPILGQAPASTPTPSAAQTPPEQLLLDELREQAREDLTIWEARVKARTAWLREATLRVATARTWRDQIEKRSKLGYEGSGVVRQAELDIAELEARREQKALELVEAQTRTTRLMRRLAVLEKADKYDVLGPILGTSSPFRSNTAEERIADLEQQIERLRTEMDETRETARTARATIDSMSTTNKPKAGAANPR